ncbi:MAG: stage III sporulation protein AG [Roseburia sp.]
MMKMQDFMQKIKEKKLKQSDWLILVLAGILILIIALPTDTKEKKQAEEAKENISKENNTMEASKNEIERKLEDILEKIDGAGDVKVMITYQDSGTQVVEKDKNTSENSLEESDSTGGVRSTKEQQLQESTVYEEADAGNTPFVSKELLPKVEGILIVASGGDNQKVKQNISEAVLALFQVEAHRIKIVKMSGLEDSK